jgi:hypothetical protein
MKAIRPRETRKTVCIGVRVRTDAGCIDATVRNVSTRGMMLQSVEPLQRNQFVEITRGRTRVVGRVVWSDDASFGLLAQDAVDITGLLQQPGAVAARVKVPGSPLPDFAAPVRSYVALDSATSSRLIARAMELAIIVLAFASLGVLTLGSALEAAEQPLEKVRIALAPTPAEAGPPVSVRSPPRNG